MTSLRDGDDIERRYVFICGLHRSGTSLLGRNVARLENCTGFKGTGVIEDEGQFLQGVYPIAKVYGGAGKFGFDPRAHLTETSPLLTPENALKLRQSWERYWDASKAIRVEKTPGNLLKTRFLQAVFPNSYFVVIRRHPVAVSMANQKWKVSLAPLHNLFDHWLHCHALFEEDRKHLKHVYELSYEDYVRNPDKYHEEIAAFIGTKVPEDAMERVTGAYNQKYFNRWPDLLNSSPFKRYYQYIAVQYEPGFANYGYSLSKGFGVKEGRLRKAKETSAIAGALYCLMADACALTVRLTTKSKGYIRRQLRAWLPQALKVRIKHGFQKISLSKKQSNVVSS
ncbi:MAG TPA: sulfotransferase [Chthoniobacterales bacterium]|jgi:hypothetical protein|nr:sulfotransferase [Chthoniobacterales bacterium]